MEDISNSLYKKYFKKMLDFLLSLLAIIVLSPVLIIIAILVKINLGSPIIFKQQRPGLNEEIFTLYKFRTMTDEKDEDGNLLPDSQRVTKLGEFLRSSSLDELPELFNILKGDMSFIGPRPLLIKYLPYYSQKERLRHSVRPGLSGLAQINGRNNLDWDSRLALDIEYVKNISITLDMKIFLMTILKAIKRENVKIIDLAPLKDLDVERSSTLKIKDLTIEEIIQYENIILELLINAYMSNFQITIDNCIEICNGKIQMLKDYVINGSANVLGAIYEEKLVGILWIFKYEFFGEKRLHINQISVLKQYQGRGIAKRLIQELEKRAKEESIFIIDLSVSEINKNALEFYNKIGFQTERRNMIKKL